MWKFLHFWGYNWIQEKAPEKGWFVILILNLNFDVAKVKLVVWFHSFYVS